MVNVEPDKKKAMRHVEGALKLLSDRRGSLVPVVSQLLEAARMLEMRGEVKWLDSELHGYGRGIKQTMPLNQALELPEGSALVVAINDYRLLRLPMHIDLGHGDLRDVRYPHMLTEKVSDIEHRLDRVQAGDQAVITIQSFAMPPPFDGLMRAMQVSELRFPLTALHFAHALEGLRATLAGFASSLQVQLYEPPEPHGGGTASQVISGSITASVVTIVNAAGTAKVSISTVDPGMEPRKALDQLRDEIAGIQDLLIGNRKDHLFVEQNLKELQSALSMVVDQMAASIASAKTEAVTVEDLRRVANEISGDLIAERLTGSKSKLVELVSMGFHQSMLASVVFEGIKAVVTP